MKRRLGGNLLALGISTVVTLIVFEAGSRIWLNRVASEDQFREYASRRQLDARFGSTTDASHKYALHRYIGYYPNPNHRYRKNRHNALGFRGEEIAREKPSNEFRIVCMGGSTTYTGHVNDYTKSYPRQLERILRDEGWNVCVINAGAEAYTSYETLLTFQLRVLPLKPDLVIVYHGVNDALERFVWPPEAYRADNSGSRGPVVSDLFMPNILEYSTLLRIARIRLGFAKPHSALPAFYDVHEPTFHAFKWRDQKVAGTYPSGVFTDATARTMLETNPPRHFRRNIKLLIAAASQFNAHTVLATFAHCPGFEDEPWVSDPVFAAVYPEMNRVITEIAENTDAELFDFASAFPTSETEYFTDGIHMNADGAHLKAELFAGYLETQALIPERYRN